jgi:hypothetical protein
VGSQAPAVTYERDAKGEATWNLLVQQPFEAAVVAEINLIEQELAVQRVQVDGMWPDTEAIRPLFLIKGAASATPY